MQIWNMDCCTIEQNNFVLESLNKQITCSIYQVENTEWNRRIRHIVLDLQLRFWVIKHTLTLAAP